MKSDLNPPPSLSQMYLPRPNLGFEVESTERKHGFLHTQYKIEILWLFKSFTLSYLIGQRGHQNTSALFFIRSLNISNINILSIIIIIIRYF
jgi:hypothetical protein